MKYLLLFLLPLFLLGCDDDDDYGIDMLGEEFEYLVGDENGMIADTLDVPDETNLQIMLHRMSLCPSHGVELYVENNGSVLLDALVEADESYQFELDGDSELIIRAEAVLTATGVACVWLGNAQVSGEY